MSLHHLQTSSFLTETARSLRLRLSPGGSAGSHHVSEVGLVGRPTPKHHALITRNGGTEAPVQVTRSRAGNSGARVSLRDGSLPVCGRIHGERGEACSQWGGSPKRCGLMAPAGTLPFGADTGASGSQRCFRKGAASSPLGERKGDRPDPPHRLQASFRQTALPLTARVSWCTYREWHPPRGFSGLVPPTQRH